METTFAPEKTKAKTVKSNKPPKELPGMPEKDALGKSADRFRAASNAVIVAKDKLGEAAADLMIEMRHQLLNDAFAHGDGGDDRHFKLR